MKTSTADQLKEIMFELSAKALDIKDDKTYKKIIKVRDKITTIIEELERLPF